WRPRCRRASSPPGRRGTRPGRQARVRRPRPCPCSCDRSGVTRPRDNNRTRLRCTERFAIQNIVLLLRMTRRGVQGMAGLLAGTRVLDLTNVLAGPFCCYQLALLGAEVIKVEVPGSGDLARQLGADPELNRRGMGASFLAQNAGKRSIRLNLKSP